MRVVVVLVLLEVVEEEMDKDVVVFQTKKRRTRRSLVPRCREDKVSHCQSTPRFQVAALRGARFCSGLHPAVVLASHAAAKVERQLFDRGSEGGPGHVAVGFSISFVKLPSLVIVGHPFQLSLGVLVLLSQLQSQFRLGFCPLCDMSVTDNWS